MAKSLRGQIADLIADVEKRARRLRGDLRKQYKAVPKSLDKAARRLREGASEVAQQVERYVREFPFDLQGLGGRGAAVKKRAAKKRGTAKKTARKAAGKTARKAAKKTARKTAKKAARKTVKKATRKGAKKTARKRS